MRPGRERKRRCGAFASQKRGSDYGLRVLRRLSSCPVKEGVTEPAVVCLSMLVDGLHRRVDRVDLLLAAAPARNSPVPATPVKANRVPYVRVTTSARSTVRIQSDDITVRDPFAMELFYPDILRVRRAPLAPRSLHVRGPSWSTLDRLCLRSRTMKGHRGHRPRIVPQSGDRCRPPPEPDCTSRPRKTAVELAATTGFRPRCAAMRSRR
jgi:hypothetical protein